MGYGYICSSCIASLVWPDHLCTGTYQLEIISAGLQGPEYFIGNFDNLKEEIGLRFGLTVFELLQTLNEV